jgi:hypothetical protein
MLLSPGDNLTTLLPGNFFALLILLADIIIIIIIIINPFNVLYKSNTIVGRPGP